MMNRTTTNSPAPGSGFTFVEVLAAMLFMAIVIPVAVRGVTLANRAGVAAERKREAARLGDALLSELVLTDDWREAETEGDFGEDWPEYRWVLATEAWETDTMRVVTLEVFYSVQGAEYSLALSTLALEEEEIEGETEE